MPHSSNAPTELRPAWRNYWPGMALIAVLVLALLGAMIDGHGDAGMYVLAILAIAAIILWKRFSWKFEIGDERLQRHYGLIARNQQGVRLQDLRSIELSQGVIQRLLGVGNLHLYSAGSAEAEIAFRGIKEPAAWRDRIETLRDRVQKG